jgi:hypothetical protein
MTFRLAKGILYITLGAISPLLFVQEPFLALVQAFVFVTVGLLLVVKDLKSRQ